eukprot:TRINITY_DN2791_c0_g1_i1.p1 TRINITY_DN2791_c0_g1~~TRINITY_DN2791_c0_g1_i1.p1  ORF type:complete len:780 (+),score=160.50 TRINITY_DN2791_c0_g1_i1:243-2582(+)
MASFFLHPSMDPCIMSCPTSSVLSASSNSATSIALPFAYNGLQKSKISECSPFSGNSKASRRASSVTVTASQEHYRDVELAMREQDKALAKTRARPGTEVAGTEPTPNPKPKSAVEGTMVSATIAGVPPPGDLFHVVSTSKDSRFDIDYLGESTKGDMKVLRSFFDSLENEGHHEQEKQPVKGGAQVVAAEAESLMESLRDPFGFPVGQDARGIFCSRTLNLRSITTIGYDMDYTLIHYNVNAWEGRAYEYAKENLKAKGFPVEGLTFDEDLVIRGLIMDKENGNLVKADRFGYVKRALHGSTMLSNRSISRLYGRELIDLRDEERWEFLNTLFSVSEAVMYMQMVGKLDELRELPEVPPGDYKALHKAVARALFRAHVEGQLKAEIVNDPDRFVELDPELATTLLDQREAGKRLILITNSDYHYTAKMMSHSFDRFLPEGMTWRKLFDMVIVSARKPEFFSMNHPLYEIVTEEGLMRPCFKAIPGGLYCGGSAQMVERALGFSGDETLYVGDHIYTDVSQSKLHLRWRTALVCRELEKEVEALADGQEHRARLVDLVKQKEDAGTVFNQLRLALQRRSGGRAAQSSAAASMGDEELAANMQRLLLLMERLDGAIAPMIEEEGAFFNKLWGYLSRAGLWDKSHLTRQIEKYADIYTSRVSNFLRYTPFMYFRSHAQSLAHDRGAVSDEEVASLVAKILHRREGSEPDEGGQEEHDEVPGEAISASSSSNRSKSSSISDSIVATLRDGSLTPPATPLQSSSNNGAGFQTAAVGSATKEVS